MMLGATPELWVTMLAAMKLGLVLIPAMPQLSPADIADRLERGRAKFLVAHGADAEKFADIETKVVRIAVGAAPEGWRPFASLMSPNARFQPDGPTRADDPMLLYFTSGTTARSKLVVHSHASYPIGHLTTMYGLGLKPGDVHLNISSPGWAKHAWSSVFAPWNAGATVVALAGRFEPRAALDALVAHGVTTFCAPPTVWRMLIQETSAPGRSSMREIMSSGEPLNPEVIDRVRRAWGLTLRDSYGQTETTMMVANSPGQKVIPGSMGRPLPGYRIALLDADGLESDQGEIALPLRPRPVGLMSGYADETGGPAPVGGAYYRTGDVASRDAEGYITYVGRADDVFKSSDYRLSPFELESALIEHEAVVEAAVVPAPDPVRFTTPKAYVVLAAGFPAERRDGRLDLRPCPRAAVALQARAPDRVLPNCRRRRPGRSAGSNCAAARPSWPRRASGAGRVPDRGLSRRLTRRGRRATRNVVSSSNPTWTRGFLRNRRVRRRNLVLTWFGVHQCVRIGVGRLITFSRSSFWV